MPTGDLKILVLNPKGGSGKTTLATTLAAAFARRGPPPTLFDCDSQGFSLRWLDKRPADRPRIHGVAAYGRAAEEDPMFTRMHPESRVAIIDLPAAIPHDELYRYTYLADRILIPIVPSEIDVFAASRLIAELLLDAQLDRRDGKLAIVANRVRSTTRSFRQLRAFLGSLKIPMIATLRDTQNFVAATAHGLGLTELPSHAIRDDLAQVDAILTWLERRPVSETVLRFPDVWRPAPLVAGLDA